MKKLIIQIISTILQIADSLMCRLGFKRPTIIYTWMVEFVRKCLCFSTDSIMQIWDGITIGDKVYIGANTTFTNGKYRHAKDPSWKLEKTFINKGASIGASCTIECGITIGNNAMIDMRPVVTHDVPANELWVGNPAKFLKRITDIV